MYPDTEVSSTANVLSAVCILSYAIDFHTKSTRKPRSRSVGGLLPCLSSMPTSSDCDKRTTEPKPSQGAYESPP